MRVELFHVIADAASAEVRRFVNDSDLQEWVRFRNLDYPEVHADFLTRGGSAPPALWDGEQLFQGPQACIARLRALLDLGRAP